jgi:hypothetical protein
MPSKKPEWKQVASMASMKNFPILSKLNGKHHVTSLSNLSTVYFLCNCWENKGSHACWLRLCNAPYDWLFSKRRFPWAYTNELATCTIAFVLVWQDVNLRGHKRWSIINNRYSVKLFRCWITWAEEIFYVILSEGDYSLYFLLM